MTKCLICHRPIDLTREAINAHAEWHVDVALAAWVAFWEIENRGTFTTERWAVDENWMI